MSIKRNLLKWGYVRYLDFRSLSSAYRKDPDFLIIGTQKGGTTSLYSYLAQHPQIVCPLKKELHYFNKYSHKNIYWYKASFPFRKRKRSLTFEATPNYLFYESVPMRVYRFYPYIKLIVILRDPIERAISDYKMAIRRKHETEGDISQAFQDEILRYRSFKPKESLNARDVFDIEYRSYLNRGKYYSQISNWLKHFNIEQFLFIKAEEFYSNPSIELNRIYSFLNIECIFPDDLKIRNIGLNELDFNRGFIESKYRSFYKDEYEMLSSLINYNIAWI